MSLTIPKVSKKSILRDVFGMVVILAISLMGLFSFVAYNYEQPKINKCCHCKT